MGERTRGEIERHRFVDPQVAAGLHLDRDVEPIRRVVLRRRACWRRQQRERDDRPQGDAAGGFGARDPACHGWAIESFSWSFAFKSVPKNASFRCSTVLRVVPRPAIRAPLHPREVDHRQRMLEHLAGRRRKSQ